MVPSTPLPVPARSAASMAHLLLEDQHVVGALLEDMLPLLVEALLGYRLGVLPRLHCLCVVLRRSP